MKRICKKLAYRANVGQCERTTCYISRAQFTYMTKLYQPMQLNSNLIHAESLYIFYVRHDKTQ